MKALRFVVVSQLLAWAAFAVEVRYVSPTGADHPPYTSWATAARTIQAAVDAADQGDIVVVGPGDYIEQVTLRQEMILAGSGSDSTTLRQPEGAANVITGGARVQIRDLALLGALDRPEDPWGNYTTGILLVGGSGQVVSNCSIQGWFGCGILADGLVVGDPCVIRETAVSGCEDGLWLVGRRGRCAIKECTLKDNHSSGAILYYMETALVIRTNFHRSVLVLYHTPQVSLVACALRCPTQPHAIFSSFNTVTLASSLIVGPQYAVYMSENTLLMVHNSTITQCHAPFYVAEEGEVRINSSIIWGNSQELSDPDIRWMITGVLTSDIEGGGFQPPSPYAPANIDLDPLFRNPGNGDFHLRPESPCIDYAEWDGALYDFDLDGNPRALYGGKAHYPRRDLGAYEYRINDLQPGPGPNQSTLTWSSLADRTYSIFYTDDLFNWHTAIDNFPSLGNTTTSWTDDGTLTGLPPSLVPRRFYRILENP